MTLASLVRIPEPAVSQPERWPAIADRWDWAVEIERLRKNMRDEVARIMKEPASW